MLRSLVGSEMCIRDRVEWRRIRRCAGETHSTVRVSVPARRSCLLYTSDAADEEDSVDLGGRRLIQAEDGIRDAQESRGLGDVYKRQGGVEADPALRRRDPLDGAGQRAGAQVEHALVLAQLAVPHVERLIVDEQPNQLAIRDVDDRLP